MLVLGIESTCDETGAAIVKDGHLILSNVVFSQSMLHKRFGGVYPEWASRKHVDNMIPIIDEAFKTASISPEKIDLIAVAKGPGLIGPLLIGLNTAKALSFSWEKPMIGINHVEAHLYAAMMPHSNQLLFPSLGVVISGGHTFMVLIKNIGNYELIGQTRDDAIGEAFDKVAHILGLPYPGGPEIEKLARKGNQRKFFFKPGRVKNAPFDFSFSGLKTNVMYSVKGKNSKRTDPIIISNEEKKDIAAAFQETALSDIVDKILLAIKKYAPKAVYLGGGVANNRRLQDLLQKKLENHPFFLPPKDLTLDNAAMIAGLAYPVYLKNKKADSLSLEPMTRIPLTSAPLT